MISPLERNEEKRNASRVCWNSLNCLPLFVVHEPTAIKPALHKHLPYIHLIHPTRSNFKLLLRPPYNILLVAQVREDPFSLPLLLLLIVEVLESNQHRAHLDPRVLEELSTLKVEREVDHRFGGESVHGSVLKEGEGPDSKRGVGWNRSFFDGRGVEERFLFDLGEDPEDVVLLSEVEEVDGFVYGPVESVGDGVGSGRVKEVKEGLEVFGIVREVYDGKFSDPFDGSRLGDVEHVSNGFGAGGEGGGTEGEVKTRWSAGGDVATVDDSVLCCGNLRESDDEICIVVVEGEGENGFIDDFLTFGRRGGHDRLR